MFSRDPSSLAARIVRLAGNAAIIALLLLVPMGAPTGALAAPAPARQSTAKQDPQTVTVYVTKTGAKYHRDGCRYLSKSKIPMSLKEAAMRFEPCKVCRPPVLK